MRTHKTSVDTNNFATISTIEQPLHIERLSDLPDFRINLVNDRAQRFVVYFTFDPKRPLRGHETAETIAAQLYRDMKEHINSPEFHKTYGRSLFQRDDLGAKPQLVRIKEFLVRLVRNSNLMSVVRASPCPKDHPGLVTVDVRFLRASGIRIIPRKLLPHMEHKADNIAGRVTIFGQDCVFFTWAPLTYGVASVPPEVWQKEFAQQMAKDFPFIDVSDVKLEFSSVQEIIVQA